MQDLLQQQEDLIYFCSLYLTQKRNGDAIETIKELINLNPVLDNKTRGYFQVVYKQIIDGLRNSLGLVNTFYEMEQELNHTEMASFLLKKKEELCDKLIPLCKEAIGLIDNVLIPNAQDPQMSVYLLKLKGDFYRYVAEYSDETESVSAANMGEEAYIEAFNISDSNLPFFDTVRLTLVLNAAVFRYEIRKNTESAMEMLENEINNSEQILQNLNEIDQKEAMTTLGLMKQNLSIWAEAKDEEK
ncbi:14-3-3 protein [Histomonas meleagridis]|uniref:14-3-3 protein n=1 Tax=Histomonas meleagridis TaxID=135588 RepID=UPI003559C5A0|nr:14-3-3 protein [Histomonas meleagridis]KAH0802297.1 14-3-3 protein [Histomonas meleagridis]